MQATELGELEAFRDLFAAAPAEAGARAQEIGGALCLRLDGARSAPKFNRAIGLGLGEPATEEALDEITAFLAGTASLGAGAPAASPRELGAFVVRGYGVPAPIFGPWLQALAGRDGWHCFVALDGEKPAGAGALFVTGEVGWLGIGATVPDTGARARRALFWPRGSPPRRGAGCTVVTTETGEPRGGEPNPSWRNIARSGFRAALRARELGAARALGQQGGDAREGLADAGREHRERAERRQGDEPGQEAIGHPAASVDRSADHTTDSYAAR